MRIKRNEVLKKSNGIIFIFILAILTAAFLWHQYDIISSRDYKQLDPVALANKFLIVAIISTVCVFLSYIWIIKKQTAISKIYLLSIIVLGIAYMMIFLPHTVPDEPYHYFKAYELSNYFTFNFGQADSDFLMMRQSDIDWYQTTASTSQSAEHFYKIQQSFSFFSTDNIMVNFKDRTAGGSTNAPFGYIFSALGIAVARIFNFSPIITYYFGRFFNLLSYAFMTWWAVKRMPYGKIAAFAISVLPMSLHLTASYSYDSQIVAFVMLFVAQILYMTEKDDKISYKDIILCTIFGMLVAPSKLVYLPLVLLVFIIPKEKFSLSSKKVFWIKAAMLSAIILFMLLIQLKTFVNSVSDSSISWSEEDAYSIPWLLGNPIDAVKIYVDTFLVKGDFYLKSMVGYSLGWFQVAVPFYCYFPFFIFLVYSFIARDGESLKIGFESKFWATLLVFGSILLILTSMLLSWTPMSYTAIEGVQGRYFIPLLIVLCLIVRNKFITVRPEADKYFMFIVLYWSLITGIEYFVGSFV